MDRYCNVCGRSYIALRASSKYCGATCRNRHARGAESIDRTPPPALANGGLIVDPGSLVEATKMELDAVGRGDSAIGRAALVMAAKIQNGKESGSSLAALNREWRATMAEAVRGVAVAEDPIDELRARRDKKRAG